MVSDGSLWVFLLLFSALADQYFFHPDPGGDSGSAGRNLAVKGQNPDCPGKRTFSSLSGNSFHLCLCVYHGRVYAGAAFGSVCSVLYRKEQVGLCAGSGVPGP